MSQVLAVRPNSHLDGLLRSPTPEVYSASILIAGSIFWVYGRRVRSLCRARSQGHPLPRVLSDLPDRHPLSNVARPWVGSSGPFGAASPESLSECGRLVICNGHRVVFRKPVFVDPDRDEEAGHYYSVWRRCFSSGLALPRARGLAQIGSLRETKQPDRGVNCETNGAPLPWSALALRLECRPPHFCDCLLCAFS